MMKSVKSLSSCEGMGNRLSEWLFFFPLCFWGRYYFLIFNSYSLYIYELNNYLVEYKRLKDVPQIIDLYIVKDYIHC